MTIVYNTSAVFETYSPVSPIRLDPNRNINIVDLLPEYLKESETKEVVQFLMAV